MSTEKKVLNADFMAFFEKIQLFSKNSQKNSKIFQKLKKIQKKNSKNTEHFKKHITVCELLFVSFQAV